MATKRKLSAAGRKAISESTKKRWAAYRKAQQRETVQRLENLTKQRDTRKRSYTPPLPELNYCPNCGCTLKEATR